MNTNVVKNCGLFQGTSVGMYLDKMKNFYFLILLTLHRQYN